MFILPQTGPKEPNKNNCTYAELIFTLCPELFGLYEGIANPTGVALMIILTVMVVCSLPFVRKSGYFEVCVRGGMERICNGKRKERRGICVC